MRGVIGNYKIKKQLIIFMVSIIFIPIFAINIIFAYMYIGFYNEKINEEYRSFKEESFTNLNYKLKLYQSMIERTVYNKSIINAIAGIEKGSLISAFAGASVIDAEVENITYGNAMEEVYNFSIFPYDANIRGVGKYLAGIDNVINEPWLKEMDGKSKYIFIDNKRGYHLLSIAQVIYYTDELAKQTTPIAVARIEINLDGIFKNTIDGRSSGIGVELLQDGKVVYGYGALCLQDSSRKVLALEEGFLEEQFTIRYIFDKSQQNRMFVLITCGFCTFAAILLLALTGMIIWFSDGINKRVAVILKKILRIENGEFDIEATLGGNDEFADIDCKIKNMANKLEKTINENYVIEAERKRAELFALQMQINPHFMYNTLEMINSMAKQNGCEDIGLISQQMGKILRYNVENDSEYVTLEQEIRHIKSYLYIQQIRYRDRFDVFYDLPERVLGCRVLKFILQPIVENAIKYAVQPNEGRYFISITAAEEEGTLIISVQDDGAGMTEQRLDEVRRRIEDKSIGESGSIGLKNVHSRIRITYGEGYGLSISSKENIGTNVTLRLPAEHSEGLGEQASERADS